MTLLPKRITFVVFLIATAPLSVQAEEPINIGLRRELFVDNFLVDSLTGARRRLHHPTPKEIAIVHDAPWEGNVCYYHTVFRDGDLYRMYYRGAHAGTRSKYQNAVGHEVVCYAESRDGVKWTKPKLGLHEFNGSKENNIIWTGVGTHTFVPFKDPNPKSKPEARYKAMAATHEGMYALQSVDAIHWSLMKKKPVVTKGAFDSQNLAFYDLARGRYVEFHRGFQKGVRAVMTSVSDDFITWTDPKFIEFTDDRNEHLYTNQTTAYPRAPQILMSFPKRFVPGRNPARHRYHGVSDVVFMSSRDGQTFDRWGEAFIRPGLQRERWVNRNNFVAWGIVETAHGHEGVGDELSFYSIEGYYRGDDCRMRRYALRPDGFVSVHAPLKGGELLTKPITFAFPPKDLLRSTSENSSFQLDKKSPLSGKRSLVFDQPTIFTIDNTKNLGKQATLAVKVRGVPAGLRRLFSTYNGGSTNPNELFFDVNSGGVIGNDGVYSIRFDYNGVQVGAKFENVGNWSRKVDAHSVHHVAATWDDGQVAIYFDGRLVGQGGQSGAGELKFALGDLRFGEDYPPTLRSNEPFLGTADDILVLRRVLNPAEIAQLAKIGHKALKPSDRGVFVSAEHKTEPLLDHLPADGQQPVFNPGAGLPGDVELLINFSTSAAGSLRCEIQDSDGKPIPGFSLKDCDELYGDSLEQALSWKGKRELKSLVGKPIKLRFVLRDADLYAIRFGR